MDRQEKDGTDFMALFLECREEMGWVALRVLHHADPDGIEDVIQDAFLRCFRTYVPDEVRSFRPWILTATYRAAIDRIRRETGRGRMKRVDDAASHLEAAESPEDGAEALLLRHERQAAIEAAIEQVLSEEQRLIYRLRLEGVPYKEIAERLGMKTAGVSSSVHWSNVRIREFVLKQIGS